MQTLWNKKKWIFSPNYNFGFSLKPSISVSNKKKMSVIKEYIDKTGDTFLKSGPKKPDTLRSRRESRDVLIVSVITTA